MARAGEICPASHDPAGSDESDRPGVWIGGSCYLLVGGFQDLESCGAFHSFHASRMASEALGLDAEGGSTEFKAWTLGANEPMPANWMGAIRLKLERTDESCSATGLCGRNCLRLSSKIDFRYDTVLRWPT